MSDWREALLERNPPGVWAGIDTGDGWRPLIEYLYDAANDRACISIAQVKEKFGGLRFYIDHDFECEVEDCHAAESMYKAIDTIEALSYRICETCGKHGKLTGKSWVKTLCEECWEAAQ